MIVFSCEFSLLHLRTICISHAPDVAIQGRQVCIHLVALSVRKCTITGTLEPAAEGPSVLNLTLGTWSDLLPQPSKCRLKSTTGCALGMRPSQG